MDLFISCKSGPWRRRAVLIHRASRTLQEIEHGIWRKKQKWNECLIEGSGEIVS